MRTRTNNHQQHRRPDEEVADSQGPCGSSWPTTLPSDLWPSYRCRKARDASSPGAGKLRTDTPALLAVHPPSQQRESVVAKLWVFLAQWRATCWSPPGRSSSVKAKRGRSKGGGGGGRAEGGELKAPPEGEALKRGLDLAELKLAQRFSKAEARRDVFLLCCWGCWLSVPGGDGAKGGWLFCEKLWGDDRSHHAVAQDIL